MRQIDGHIAGLRHKTPASGASSESFRQRNKVDFPVARTGTMITTRSPLGRFKRRCFQNTVVLTE